MSKIKTVGIVGTGVIGTGWIIRNLAHNKIVHAYDQNKNLKKQLQYADRKKLDIAIICGENELKDEKLTIKKLNSSKENDQLSISRNEFINEIKKLI